MWFGSSSADKVCYHHILLLLGRLRSVFRGESTVQFYQDSFIISPLSWILGTWMAKHKKSNLTERVHVMKSFFTKTTCEAQKEADNAKTQQNTNQESWKIFWTICQVKIRMYYIIGIRIRILLIRIIQPVGRESSSQTFNHERWLTSVLIIIFIIIFIVESSRSKPGPDQHQTIRREESWLLARPTWRVMALSLSKLIWEMLFKYF